MCKLEYECIFVVASTVGTEEHVLSLIVSMSCVFLSHVVIVISVLSFLASVCPSGCNVWSYGDNEKRMQFHLDQPFSSILAR